jgi:uncharacterized protein YdaU (DUF1376 family)
MSATSPAFQFYPHDFVGGRVATYSLEEIGAYSLLLAFDWSLSGLPVEVEKLAKLCRVSLRKFRPIWAVIGEQFPEENGRRYNPRLKLERAKQATNREKKKRAAASRWNAHADASALQMECSPSPSPSPINYLTTNSDANVNGGASEHRPPDRPPRALRSTRARGARSLPPYDQVFQEAWSAYPSRPGNNKAEAWEQWLKRVGEGVDPVEMLSGTTRFARWVNSRVWEDRRHIPMARTFFGEKRKFADDWGDGGGAFIAPPVVNGWLSDEVERMTRPAHV